MGLRSKTRAAIGLAAAMAVISSAYVVGWWNGKDGGANYDGWRVTASPYLWLPILFDADSISGRRSRPWTCA